MRPPDGHHQQDSLFLCELVYLASPTSIRKRANRTQAYIFHLWHASLGLCKTRQQTKAWMTASTSYRAINLARRQSRNTMSPLIGYTEKNEKKTKQHPKTSHPVSNNAEQGTEPWQGVTQLEEQGCRYQDTWGKNVFLGNSLLFQGIYSCNKAVVARGLG